jgi:hypothetical protein
MGFEIFVERFRDKEPAPYARKIAEEIFNRDAIEPTTPLNEVRYADGGAEIDGAVDDEMSGFVVAHFSGRIVLERLLELAQRTGSVIIWPGEETCAAVTSSEWLAHLPEDMIESMQPVVVRTVDELVAVIGLA